VITAVLQILLIVTGRYRHIERIVVVHWDSRPVLRHRAGARSIPTGARPPTMQWFLSSTARACWWPSACWGPSSCPITYTCTPTWCFSAHSPMMTKVAGD
jgi:hypothetical protein